MHGYTTIEINGQTIGLTFGLPAIKQLTQEAQDTTLFSGTTYTEEGIALVLYAGYTNNCFLERQKPTLSFRPFYELVELAVQNPDTLGQIQDALKVFEESKFVKTAVEAKNEDEQAKFEASKKKIGTGTKSRGSATVS